MCLSLLVFRGGPGGGFREYRILCWKDGEKGGTVSPEYHVNDYLCSVRVVTDAQNIANFSLRAGFDVSHFRLFFEQHFNTDKARASFFGLTYYF